MKRTLMGVLLVAFIFVTLISSCSKTATSEPTTTSAATTTITSNSTTTTGASGTTTTTAGGGTTTTTSSTTTTTFDHDNATWTVDAPSTSGSGAESKIIIDSSNKVHIFHFGSGLIETTKPADSSTWSDSTVDSLASTTQIHSLSVAIDSAGGLHVAYFDTSRNLKYAYKAEADTSWTKSTLASGVGEGGGMISAIAVDSSNNPHIIYYDIPNDQLRYITKSSGSWSTPVVVVDSGITECGLVVTSSGTPEAVFLATYLYYASYTGGTWTVDTPAIDSGYTMKGVSIALDSTDNLHVAYARYYTDDTRYKLMHSDKNGSWVPEIAKDYLGVYGGGYSSIAIDRNNNLFLSSYSRTSSSSSIGVAYRIGSGSWQSPYVTSSKDDAWEYGLYNSCALDSSGRLHVSFQKGSTNSLQY